MASIYLDYAATTPTHPEVLDAMLPFFRENFGNPSGLHSISREAKKVLKKSREFLAQTLNAEVEEIIFTGGGSEANNLAIFGFDKTQTQNYHAITSYIEHPSVYECFGELKKAGKAEVSFLSPTSEGEITVENLAKNSQKNTKFVSIMWGNNEIGTINNVNSLAEFCQKKNIVFHTDACQAFGSEKIDVQKTPADMITLNSSKIYGPKGVGALFKKKNVEISPLIYGGEQEFGLRAGTENVAGIVGFTKAIELAEKSREKEKQRLTKIRENFIGKVIKHIPNSRLNGSKTNRLANNINISFFGVEGETLTLMLDEAGFCCATGSACSSHTLEISRILKHIGLPHEIAHGSLRISIGKYTTEKDMENLFQNLLVIIPKIREFFPLNVEAKNFKEWFC